MIVNKPNREPDVKYSSWWFYFEEMVQYNDESHMTFLVRFEDGDLQYFSNIDAGWISYNKLSIGGNVLKSYMKYVNKLIENELLN